MCVFNVSTAPSVIVSAFLVSSLRPRLTREPPAEQIDRREIGTWHGGHVGVAGDMGPVSGEHPAAVGVRFHLPQDAMPRPFETQIQSADTREQAADSPQSRVISGSVPSRSARRAAICARMTISFASPLWSSSSKVDIVASMSAYMDFTLRRVAAI